MIQVTAVCRKADGNQTSKGGLLLKLEALESLVGVEKSSPDGSVEFGRTLFAYYFGQTGDRLDLLGAFDELLQRDTLQSGQREILSAHRDRILDFDPNGFMGVLTGFTETLDRLQVEYFIQNGTSLFLRSLEHGIVRIPTDIDICVPGANLHELMSGLNREMGYQFTYEHVGPKKWGFHYVEPQLRADIEGVNVDLIAASRIVSLEKASDIYFNDFSGVKPDVVEVNGVKYNLAPMSIVSRNKHFQSRPAPKQDLPDLYLISSVLSN